MQRLALFVAACGFAAGSAPEPHRSNSYVYSQTLTADTTVYHSLGMERLADVNLTSVVDNCATATVHLMYATNRTAAWCTANTGMCTCLTLTTSTTCQNVETSTIVESAAVTAATRTQFNAYGRSMHNFYMVIKTTGFTATCTSALVTITADVSVRSVDTAYCVRPVDMTFELQKSGTPQYFNSEAGLPYHPGKRYEISTRTVGSPTTETGNLTAAPNVIYYDLGSAPQVELTCLNIHVTSSLATAPAGCAETQLLTFGTLPTGVSYEILDLAECNAFLTAIAPVNSTVCCGATRDVCLQGVARGDCLWDGETDTCYTTWSMHRTDVVNAVNTVDVPFVFASSSVHGPQSSYVSNIESVRDWTFSNWNRRWLLAITNTNAPTTAGSGSCDLSVSTSFQSLTTGGLCEPTTRRQCDTTMDSCLATPAAQQQRFWKQYANITTFEQKYSTCNCLKQREVCFRKGGCTSTKKYQLILQNCLDQGCGNYCNSGAGVAASLLMTVLAVLAVML